MRKSFQVFDQIFIKVNMIFNYDNYYYDYYYYYYIVIIINIMVVVYCDKNKLYLVSI